MRRINRKNTRTIGFVLFLLLLTAGPPAVAQQSASYKLADSTFSAGGSPSQGQSGSSASYRISQDILGEAVLGQALSSSSFTLDGGFVRSFAPAGEVMDLVISSDSTLSWKTGSTAVTYNGYRDLIQNLSGLGYGNCERQDLPSNLWQDPDVPATGGGFFYLVTASSRLQEEGTKGMTSMGIERQGSTCP